jgi:hypothetical protein
MLKGLVERMACNGLTFPYQTMLQLHLMVLLLLLHVLSLFVYLLQTLVACNSMVLCSRKSTPGYIVLWTSITDSLNVTLMLNKLHFVFSILFNVDLFFLGHKYATVI